MPTFTTPDQFEDHKTYIPLLKKALLVVKPKTEKKFLYFQDYPFGTKKLPLVLVDYDAGFPAALAKEGRKPVAEGMVSLTADDQLDFQAKKGALKRSKLKKYFTTLGPGFKPVFVPAGEVDEDEKKEKQSSEQGGEKPSREQKAQEKQETVGDDKAKLRADLDARIAKIQAKEFPQQLDSLKKATLEKAALLGKDEDFADAKLLLDKLVARLAAATTAATPAAGAAAPGPEKEGTSTESEEPDTGPDFKTEWKAAVKQWEIASRTVDGQLEELKKALKQTGDKDLISIADNNIDRLNGNFADSLDACVNKIERLEGAALSRASSKARVIIGGFRKHIGKDAAIKACEKNPVKIAVSIQATLGAALDKLDKALATAGE